MGELAASQFRQQGGGRRHVFGGAGQQFNGLVRPAQRFEPMREGDAQIRIGRTSQGTAQRGDLAVQVARRLSDLREQLPGGQMRGVDIDRLSQLGGGFVEPAFLNERSGQRTAGLNVFRVKPYGLGQHARRRHGLVLLQQHAPLADQRGDSAAGVFARTLVGGQRPRVLVGVLQQESESNKRRWCVLQSRCALDRFVCTFSVAELQLKFGQCTMHSAVLRLASGAALKSQYRVQHRLTPVPEIDENVARPLPADAERECAPLHTAYARPKSIIRLRWM